ncbi:MAG TPA: cell division protein FtsA [Chloroflexota bacterium]|jgi:cell division protein FtsA
MGEHIVVGIDVGTTKVVTLIGEVLADGRVEVIGVGITPARGLRKGIVVSVEEAVDAIGASVRKAEQQSGFKLVGAYVGIAGGHVASENSHGVVPVRRHDKVITQEDVNRVLDAARILNLPPDREIIHMIPRYFVVDGQEGVRNPVGMLGHRLEVEANIVTGALTSVHNLLRCVERVGVGVDALVLQGLAAGEAVLTEAEKDLGVLLIDVGGGTTSAAVFVDGSISHALVLPVGGYHLTNDIAIGLRVPFATAEEIKLRYGCALASEIEEDRTLNGSAGGEGRGRQVSERMVSEILEARLAETFELVYSELRRAGYDASLPAGVVLTGGTAQLRGIRELAGVVFPGAIRIGVPQGVTGLTDALGTPASAAAVGLLRWGSVQAEEPSAAPHRKLVGGAIGAFTHWLRALLPE